MRIIRKAELADILGISIQTIWRMTKRGELPPKRQISKGCVGWLEDDIIKFLKSRPIADGDLDSKRENSEAKPSYSSNTD
ncbi:AlpA family phage regulatory protein [Rhodohalobacter sp. SW132]|uniref:helix-turn-helix transcriptional regulator n=1 Tax=Rhodohalobacter sp. SW132 TaxID=2293433 RepID=UPI000E2410D4|nr:helix-turn-helix domain-containing protein [Rhodohalobacter sp. SW132]REL39129.1 AlpA family phage regulatory protein [Rhodohalobacter sp. SW132]